MKRLLSRTGSSLYDFLLAVAGLYGLAVCLLLLLLPPYSDD